MTKQDIPRGNVVLFDWHDSKARDGWQYDPKRPRLPGHIRSLGIVVQTNDEGITISHTMSAEEPHATLDDFTVPWGVIQELSEVDVEKGIGAKDADSIGNTGS